MRTLGRFVGVAIIAAVAYLAWSALPTDGAGAAPSPAHTDRAYVMAARALIISARMMPAGLAANGDYIAGALLERDSTAEYGPTFVGVRWPCAGRSCSAGLVGPAGRQHFETNVSAVPFVPATHYDRSALMAARALVLYAQRPWADAEFIAGAVGRGEAIYDGNAQFVGYEWPCGDETCYAGRQWHAVGPVTYETGT